MRRRQSRAVIVKGHVVKQHFNPAKWWQKRDKSLVQYFRLDLSTVKARLKLKEHEAQIGCVLSVFFPSIFGRVLPAL